MQNKKDFDNIIVCPHCKEEISKAKLSGAYDDPEGGEYKCPWCEKCFIVEVKFVYKTKNVMPNFGVVCAVINKLFDRGPNHIIHANDIFKLILDYDVAIEYDEKREEFIASIIFNKDKIDEDEIICHSTEAMTAIMNVIYLYTERV